jgi:hypothetical protein
MPVSIGRTAVLEMPETPVVGQNDRSGDCKHEQRNGKSHASCVTEGGCGSMEMRS